MKPSLILACALLFATGVVGAQTQTAKPPAASGENRILLDLLNQIDALSRQMRELRGELEEMTNRVEVLNDRMQKAEKRQSDLYNDTDGRLRRMEQLAKDDGEARKKLVTQSADLEVRLKKIEAFPGSPASASQLADLDSRLKRLEGTTGSAASLTQLGEMDLRLKKLESGPVVANAPIPAPVAPTAPTPPAPPGAAATPVVAAPAAPTPPVVAPVTTNGGTPDPELIRRAYETALSKQRAGDSAGAISDFRSFLKLYPRHELAPNAQYWLGEAYFRVADYPSAIAAQQKLLVTHPDHLKAPDAMLILANAQSANGDQGGARKTLEDLIAKHPQSDAAEKAKQRLARFK